MMMSEYQQYLRIDSPTDDYIEDDISDFPAFFQIYVKQKELHCLRRNHFYGILDCIFWSLEDDRCQRPPAPCFHTTDLALKTWIANLEIIEKIKSLLTLLPKQVLVQFWKAIEIGGRRLLTTRDQPFCLTTTHEGLCSYRLISLDYEFCADGDSEEEDLGLPGRVFRHQQLECSTNVRPSKEYPQRDVCHIGGSMALPVFEPSGWFCVGVLELVMAEMYNYFTFEQYICRKLEAEGLKSLEICNHLYGQDEDKDEALEGALVEITEVLQLLCRTHDLPLAQTWVWCRLCNALFVGRSCNSRLATACHWKDKFPFSNACALHQLRKGQGVVGRAFSSHNSVFCKDVTQFNITEYPLAHHARKYGLTGCFAICLRSNYTGDNVYIIEVFLPPSNTDIGDPRITLVSLFATMQQHVRSFKVASGEQAGKELFIEVIDFSKDHKLDSFKILQTARSPDRSKTLEKGGETVWLDSSDQQLMEVDAIHTGNNSVDTTEKSDIAITSSQQKCISNLSNRQDRNAEIPISLENLQQHFGMKLEDAAKSIGVGQSTMKHACTEYNISWWQSHKRNEDLPNKSLQGSVQEQIQDSSQPQISNLPCKQDMATAACTKPQFMAVQDTSNVTTKAKYVDDFKVASGEKLGEELSIEVIDFSKDYELDSLQIPQTARSLDRPKILEDGGEMMGLDSSDQQLKEVDVIDTGNNVVNTINKGNIDITSSQQKCRINSLQRQWRKSGIPISLDDLHRHFGKKLEDAAESLGVSRSTLKRVCREYQISWWPARKRKKDKHYLSKESIQGVAQEEIPDSGHEPPISDPPLKQDMTTASRTKAHFMALQATRNMTIKAKYGNDFIKFQIPGSSGMEEFQLQVAKRLNLKGGTYSVKYQDDDNDWIVIACDEDLQDYICNSRSQGKNTVRVSLQPITNCSCTTSQ